MGVRHLKPVRTELERIHLLVDELTDCYPQIEAYVGVRSSAGAGGSSGGLAVPVNIEALTFVNEHYWYADEPADTHTTSSPSCSTWTGGRTGPRCGRCSGCHEYADVASCRSAGCGADPTNWRAGLKLTVFGLEASARRALGFGPVQRRRADGYQGTGTDQRVLDALKWLRNAVHTLVEDHSLLAHTIREELARVASRCRGMLDGTGVRIDSEWSDCQHCGLKSVCSDVVDRAVCTNVDCRRPDGTRHCWQRDPATDSWYEVEEPDRYGRGRNLSDDKVQALRHEADELARARKQA